VRFYLVRKIEQAGVSVGREWYSIKEIADKEAARWRDEDAGLDATVELVNVDRTRDGILNLLRRFASHPDNG
jgi:hypothetical protein